MSETEATEFDCAPFFDDVRQALKNHEESRRGSGRTQAMILGMTDDDVLIVRTLQEERQCIEYALSISKAINIYHATNMREFQHTIANKLAGKKCKIYVDHELARHMMMEKMRELETMVFGLCYMRCGDAFQPRPAHPENDWK